jgi:hypothetical protein
MQLTFWQSPRSLLFVAIAAWLAGLHGAQQADSQDAARANVRQSGTVKAVSGNSITLAPDSGPEVTVVVQEGARLLRVVPGQKDLKDAKPIQLTDIQSGDRILVRGVAGAVANSISASSVIDIAQSDLAAKQVRDREEWQRHGVGGLVTAVDSAGASVTITTAALADKKSVTIKVAANTVVRRYAPDSTKFDDAKVSSISAIKPGDQLRARGARSGEGSELAAEEIVSGTFRNLSGLVSSVDAAAGTLTFQDLASKKQVTVRVTSDSQLRKLPAMIAQRIAMRLKGITPDAAQASSAAGNPGNAAARQGARPGDGSPGARPGGLTGGAGRSPAGADFQQMISRMPAASLGDLEKGEAVMLVATEGSPANPSTVITLLGGVEAILEASPAANASTILSPWSLSAPAEGGATP